ncbi:phage antirepressor KilAC domain-containing protein [Neobacillus drentensis]|uniref:phage antirepressor KilAC domain-containing protein n=1 Tax=Neobacillus drentensis TaxID=220684 RepID=UPI002857A71B|nr:phage antirepressor KilAC domain-containing protein [Neobacillus drentensis]MDR7237172.1 phage antirepressor YoqD-like protein [Neobacillus drentensis]
MKELKVIEQNGVRVLTTQQLAESFGATPDKISYNFNYNQIRYKESKHYFLLTDEDLKAFKEANREFQGTLNKLYLWTEKGAWLHAKSLNTDQAWEAYEKLVDEYYLIANKHRLPTSYKEALIELLGRLEENEKLTTENLVLNQQVHELKPKASYYDMVLQNKSLLSVSKIAKDYGLSAISLNKKLHDLGVQFKQGDIWLLYAKYQDKGYTQTTTHVIDADLSRVSTKWTQKGRLFIYDLLKNECILPLIEQDLPEIV